MPFQFLVRRVRSQVDRARRRRRETRWRKVSKSATYVRHAVLPDVFVDLPAHSDLSRMVYVDDLEGTERRLLQHLLRSGDLFVDVGANFGLYTVEASKLVGRSGAVLAFEPAANAFDHLRHNAAIGQFDNIDAQQIALSDSEGQAVLKTNRSGRDAWNTIGASLHGAGHELQPVATGKLDTILAAHVPQRRPAMIKIDVEGWECHVLRGAEKLLGREDAPVLQVEFAPAYFAANGWDIAMLRDEILKHGYDLFYPTGPRSMRPYRQGIDELSGNLYAAKQSGPWFSRIEPLLEPESHAAAPAVDSNKVLPDYYRRATARIQRWNDRRTAALLLDRRSMAAIHRANRLVLTQIKEWISDDVWTSGVCHYGLPPEVRPLIDLDVGDDCTYTDALLSLVPRLRKPVSYMEIGVSVGKNFLQVASYLNGACLLGFDIEELNPVLSRRFEVVTRREWETMPVSLKKTPSSLTSFRQPGASNEIDYLCGDVFDGRSWAQLAGKKFNLLFSDAFHSPAALLTECDMLLEHELLDPDEVIIMWDDLHGAMQEAFRECCRRLARRRPGCRHISFVAPLRGWLGDNWPHHEVGFFLSVRRSHEPSEVAHATKPS